MVFANKSGVDVDDLTATLGTTSPNVECITSARPSSSAPSPTKSVSNPANYLPFQFKVANVNRSNLTEILQAKFTITVRSNKFDALTRATEITLDLDFNAAGGGGASPSLYEDFEAGFGKFTLEFLDANKVSVSTSNGFRCQYNDPFGLNRTSFGNDDCFLGFTSDRSSGVNDWHVHTSVGLDHGRWPSVHRETVASHGRSRSDRRAEDGYDPPQAHHVDQDGGLRQRRPRRRESRVALRAAGVLRR